MTTELKRSYGPMDKTLTPTGSTGNTHEITKSYVLKRLQPPLDRVMSPRLDIESPEWSNTGTTVHCDPKYGHLQPPTDTNPTNSAKSSCLSARSSSSEPSSEVSRVDGISARRVVAL